jgi:hypothetical protein
LEGERRRANLREVCFRYYDCLVCGQATIFLQIPRLEGEPLETFRQRRRALAKVARQIQVDDLKVVLLTKNPQT